MTPGVRVPKEMLKHMHVAALARLFGETEGLLEAYHALAGEASYHFARNEMMRLKLEATQASDAAHLATLRERLERRKLALARAVEEWREGLPKGYA